MSIDDFVIHRKFSGLINAQDFSTFHNHTTAPKTCGFETRASKWSNKVEVERKKQLRGPLGIVVLLFQLWRKLKTELGEWSLLFSKSFSKNYDVFFLMCVLNKLKLGVSLLQNGSLYESSWNTRSHGDNGILGLGKKTFLHFCLVTLSMDQLLIPLYLRKYGEISLAFPGHPDSCSCAQKSIAVEIYTIRRRYT